MQPIRINIPAFIILLLLAIASQAQDNTGIGTSNPHPSAILEVRDSARGVLIPNTDTLSIQEYVNTLIPNPGIADGLLIFDTILNTYLYYDALANDWKALIDLVGNRGAAGPQGPRGPMGDTGLVNDWRDSAAFDEIVLGRDTCYDWFFNPQTGEIWKMWCDDTIGGSGPSKWIDTVLWDKPIGNMMAPDENVYAFSYTYSDFQPAFLESMANDSIMVVMKDIPGLAQTVTIQPDEVAYMWFSAYGTVGKAFAGNDISYGQYDFNMGTGEFFRSANTQAFTSIGPNHPVSGRADLAGWSISGNATLYGDITDPIQCRCFTPYQDPGCMCAYSSKSIQINLRGGNRYSGSANTSFLILADGPSKETVAHFNIFVVVRRSPFADPRKR